MPFKVHACNYKHAITWPLVSFELFACCIGSSEQIVMNTTQSQDDHVVACT